MSFHAFFEFLKYKWRARGRHGTHSPFVYDFVEQVLQNKDVLDKAYIVSYRAIPLKYENLLSRVAQRYRYNTVVNLSQELKDGQVHKTDLLVMSEAEPEKWMEQYRNYVNQMDKNGAIAVPGIHKTVAHSLAWKKLCGDNEVRMSLDMYGVGLLLFREEFKEKQHFILNY